MMEVIEKLAYDLKEFDLVLFFAGEREDMEEWLGCMVKAAGPEAMSRKIRILSDKDIALKDYGNWEYRKVGREEKEALARLYFMYDFSDRFFMISDRQQYGGLFNYVKTGMLTRDEMIQAFIPFCFKGQ